MALQRAKELTITISEKHYTQHQLQLRQSLNSSLFLTCPHMQRNTKRDFQALPATTGNVSSCVITEEFVFKSNAGKGKHQYFV